MATLGNLKMTEDPSWVLVRQKRPLDLTGHVFGSLTAESVGVYRGRRGWVCRCVCGGTVTVSTNNLKNGSYTNCGCQRSERRRAASERHGHNRLGRRTKEYRAWSHLIGRCTNPADAGWADYGGRGVTVCERWAASFEAFLEDVGAAPSARHSIDRIEVNGHYEPGNCRWATAREQARNTRRAVRLDGRPLRDVADDLKIPWHRVEQRLRRGASAAQAISPLTGAAYRRAFP
jgi:hypothetical protein